MNCDNFFEMLTSAAPLSSDGRQHLEDCPRCRDLQEAIFPAITLLRSENLHVKPLESSDVAVQAAYRLQTSTRQKQQPAKPSRWSFAIAFLTGVVASLGIAVALRSEPTMAALKANSVCIWQQKQESIGTPGSSEDVILSCLNCHLTDPKFGSL